MSDTDEKTYPVSSFSGTVIPLEVARPIGSMYAVAGAAWSADLAIPADLEVVTLTALIQPAWIHFGTTATAPAIAASALLDNVVYLPVGVFKTFAVPDGSALFQVRRYGASDGIVLLEFIIAWKSTGIPGKLTRA